MDNQHRKISGYRELTQDDIDLMNRVKAKGTELLELQREVSAYLVKCQCTLAVEGPTEEFSRFLKAEPRRWASIAKTDIQTGVMALVRAIAQPEGC